MQSAQYNSVKVVKEKVETIIDIVENMQDPSKANLYTRSVVSLLLPAICYFTFLTYMRFWHRILEEINVVQQYLQSSKMTLGKGLIRLKALNEYLITERTTIVDNAVAFSTKKCFELNINIKRRGRIRTKKTMPGELPHDAFLSIYEEIRRSMFQCIDRFIQELSKRYTAMEEINKIFQVIETKFMLYAFDDALTIALDNLVKIYDEFKKEEVLLVIREQTMQLHGQV